MKKIRNLSVIVALSLCIFGCEKNILESEDESAQVAQGLTIDVVKSWYIEHRPSILTLKSGDVNLKSKEARPDWSSAFSSKNDKFEVVEVSL
jgi:hypothetical protein